jgi:alcohol dehydrogenase
MNPHATFEFRTVPHIVNRIGAAAELGSIARTAFPQTRRAMLVTDPGFLRTGLVDPVKSRLDQAGYTTLLYSNVTADPPQATVQQAASLASAQDIDLVIGLGGGSSMDVAKLVAVLAGSRQPLEEMYGIGNVRGTRLPLVQIPTTAGTGSEVTNISIVTTGETTKMGVVAPQLFADIAILDASLTTGLPSKVTAATGIDAMVHAIEAYTSKHKKNPLSDNLAREALRLLSANLLRACRNGQDLEARQSMLLGACLAGQAFSNAPVAAVHALAYPIGGIFHVPHGLSNSLVLPHVMRFNLEAAAGLYAELADIVVPGCGGSDEARAGELIGAMQHIAVNSGIETRLAQVGIFEQDLDRLADEAMKQTRLLGNNPRTVTLTDARAIYAAAL